ncbi:hypothetical protein FZ076_13825 [Listeria monocytogenes]|nr:hypothetical protein FZ076_13825 [Listeria monocytogenes]
MLFSNIIVQKETDYKWFFDIQFWITLYLPYFTTTYSLTCSFLHAIFGWSDKLWQHARNKFLLICL